MSRGGAPMSWSVRIIARTDPPRHTPHSAKAPGTPRRGQYRTASPTAWTRSPPALRERGAVPHSAPHSLASQPAGHRVGERALDDRTVLVRDLVRGSGRCGLVLAT